MVEGLSTLCLTAGSSNDGPPIPIRAYDPLFDANPFSRNALDLAHPCGTPENQQPRVINHFKSVGGVGLVSGV